MNEVETHNLRTPLVAGMNWTFTDRGVHDLKGVPDEWQLFAVDGSASLGSPA